MTEERKRDNQVGTFEKERSSEQTRNAGSGINAIREDLLGTKDWRKSKLGFLSGFSPAARVISEFMKGFAQSFGRIALTFQMLVSKDTIPSLPDIEEKDYDGKRRFKEAMHFHRMSEGMIRAARSNTRRSAYLYIAILVCAVAYLVVSLVTRDNMPITTLFLHLAPIPITTAFCVRALYYNWMFRNSTLEPIGSFARSRDWMPS
jgi:hypothetical protein